MNNNDKTEKLIERHKFANNQPAGKKVRKSLDCALRIILENLQMEELKPACKNVTGIQKSLHLNYLAIKL